MPPSPDAVPDDLILAALERAERHLRRQALPRSFVHDHLSIPSRSGEARRIKARIKALTEEGYLEQSRKNGIDVWSLTVKGRRRLKRANVAGLLPESPQHQAWRKATTLAAQEIERMHETLRTTLTEAVEQLEADAPSDMWFELSERLQRASRLVGSATHCLREWPEPSDDAPDIDDHTDTSDARLSPEQKARRKARRAGRRNVRLWGGKNS
jgi:hypothetical protein